MGRRIAVSIRQDSRAHLAAPMALGLLAAASAAALGFVPALAQDISGFGAEVSKDAPLLLVADTLIYDRDNEVITAVGNVQIDYDGNRLVARKVTYNQTTGRLMAEGNVEILYADGNRSYSDMIDITDDFRDGFVEALRVETVENTRFAAVRAERVDGQVTTFDKGVYTACEPCLDNPQKPPIWQIKARKIIWNGEEKTIRFQDARFEFFGIPIAWWPVFEIPDPTVKRKTGFLLPRAHYKSELGFGAGIPFYMALSPHYDLTVTGTGYTKQGFLGEAEWRQRFNSGSYTVKVAGIHQERPGAFNVNTEDANHVDRAMIGTVGRFSINPAWTFGWDVLVQSDKNFSRTYGIDGFEQPVHYSEVYLTGLKDRNFFDLRAMKFDVQEATADLRTNGTLNPNARQDRQPLVLPTFDYSRITDMPVAGGQLSFNFNGRILDRKTIDTANIDPSGGGGVGPGGTVVPLVDTNGDGVADKLSGAAGTNARFTAEAEWKRSFIAPGGVVLTPLLAVRGDAMGYNLDANPATAAITRSEAYRGMATAGLEARWPVLFSTSSATHILEPVAQVFARNNERYAGTSLLLNEDAQSMVFDASNLFDRDKFSGFDRTEGGTRLNYGLRYSGLFANGWSADAVFGQSIHLGGLNSFTAADYVNAGAFSGLETTRSDFVGAFNINSPVGFTLSAGGRFDERNFEMRRGELGFSYTDDMYGLSAAYTFIQAQPGYGFTIDRQEIKGGAKIKFAENWSAFTSATYDLVSNTLVNTTAGLTYLDECFGYTLSYTQRRKLVTGDISHTVGFNVSLRTLGDFGSAQTTE